MEKSVEYYLSLLPKTDDKHQIHLNRYYTFILSRPKRKYKVKSELCRHHIWPKAFGADKSFSKEKENIIVLTNREHYIAHLILHKGYGNKMTQAFSMMNKKKMLSGQYTNLTSRQYLNLVNENSIIHSIEISGVNHPNFGTHNFSGEKNPMYGIHRYGEKAPGYGRKATKETREKQSAKAKERFSIAENREKQSRRLSGSKAPFYGRMHTKETKKILSEQKKGNHYSLGSKHSKEMNEKQRKRNLGEKNPMYGTHQSIETVLKHSTPIIGINLVTNEVTYFYS